MSVPMLLPGCPRQTLYRRLAAFGAMLAAAMVYRVGHLSDWDSWDYAAQAMMGHSSDLLLGRWWFIAVMRGAWLLGRAAWGLDASTGHLAMQAASALLMATALVVLMAWTYRLTRSIAGEFIIVALLVPGPFVGIYASAVMTESLTVLMLGLAFWLWEGAIGKWGLGTFRVVGEKLPVPIFRRPVFALLAGYAFGVAIDIREPAVLFCAWPILSVLTDRPAGGWRLLGLAVLGSVLTLGIGILGAWAWYPWTDVTYFQNMFTWTRSMAQERQTFALSPADNLGWLVYYCKMTSSAATWLLLPAVAWAVVRRWVAWRPSSAAMSATDLCPAATWESGSGRAWNMAADDGRHATHRLAWLALGAAPYAGSLLLNHDLCVNPRFVLPLLWVTAPVIAGMIVDLALAAGACFRVRLAAVMLVLVAWGAYALLGSWTDVNRIYFAYTDAMEEAYQCLMRQVPDGSVVIAGPATPVVFHVNRLRVRDFEPIATGWKWPGPKLKGMIRKHLADGRAVYVNIDKSLWMAGTRKLGEWETLAEALDGCRVCPDTYPLVRVLPATVTTTTTSTGRAGSDP